MERCKLEAVAEAIMRTSGYTQPENPLYVARNPGGLKAFSPSQPKDEHGNRVFNSLLDGLQALLFDVSLKLEGKSRHKLGPSSTLAEFAVACGQPATAATAWAAFLRKALHDETINQKVHLSYFTETK